MADLTPSDFAAFFRELHGRHPFPWQERLANQVCDGGWPRVIDLPTASGKTACIDVAVFAMVARMRGPRRVFFVVDRRVVVDAAFDRMSTIARRLHEAEGGVLKEVADRLRILGDAKTPLDVYQLRGGIYRDDSWVRSPIQPTLVASTVDQVGSRLLFRGYGVSEFALPIHASLIANDALILLDEAHCSRPFSQTVAAIERFRGPDWADVDLGAPFAFVEMTATPEREAGEPFRLNDADYTSMAQRLQVSKPARLVTCKARAGEHGKLAEALIRKALELAKTPRTRRIAILVNRVRTARIAHQLLREAGGNVHLLIGRMRPIDRENLPEDLQAMLSGQARTLDGEPVFVVATQCLEVGADLDFDVLVTECASIDALLQRFGRLDRIGDFTASGGTPRGWIVIASAAADGKHPDPIYGDALAKTWKWLSEAADGNGAVDFGIRSAEGGHTVRERLSESAEAEGLRREAPAGPTLFPSHLDLLAQTSPRPAAEPEVSYFLHGEPSRVAEVQVVWRADLDDAPPESWAEIVSLCPPVAAEAMTVPLSDFRRWWTGNDPAASSDIEGVEDEGEDKEEKQAQRAELPVLCWRGEKSVLAFSPWEIAPNDTLVLAEARGWQAIGHIPKRVGSIDEAERARLSLRRGWILRLHPKLMAWWPDRPALSDIKRMIEQQQTDAKELRDALTAYREELGEEAPWPAAALKRLPTKLDLEPYPETAKTTGWVAFGRFAEEDAGNDEASSSEAIILTRHLADVSEQTRESARRLVGDHEARSLVRAAELHDVGKSDIRFQALLRGGDRLAAQFAPVLLAKGAAAKLSRRARQAQWERSELPEGFRHELVSLLLASEAADIAGNDLVAHLIASHHGRCRPFAPVVNDAGDELVYNGWRITAEARSSGAAHRLDSGVTERFWRLTRRYGWWGLAYLEAVLRLADWKASRLEAVEEDR